MDPIKVTQVEQFRTISVLKTGVMIDSEGNQCYDFLDNLDILERIKRIRENPKDDPHMAAAFIAFDQGLTSANFHDYFEHSQELSHQEELRKRTEHEKTIKEYNRLVDYNKFEEIEGIQFPKHYHFKFNRIVKNQTYEITCRVFNPSYGKMRLWYQWKDPKTKKTNKHCINIMTHWFTMPAWMPTWWNDRWSLSKRCVALAFAHAMTTSCRQSFNNVVKPK